MRDKMQDARCEHDVGCETVTRDTYVTPRPHSQVMSVVRLVEHPIFFRAKKGECIMNLALYGLVLSRLLACLFLVCFLWFPSDIGRGSSWKLDEQDP
jgi:hypothetical protein